MAKEKVTDQPGRVAQLRQAYRMTKQQDPSLPWWMLGAFLLGFGVFLLIGILVGGPWLWSLAITGIAVGLLLATVVFSRKVERAAYLSLQGQAGAAAAALQMMRKGVTVTPAVAVTRNQDIVHRVTGRHGVLLVGEGASSRVGNLLANEHKRHARVAGDAPVLEVQVGDGEGQVPLPKLNGYVLKLPKTLSPEQVRELESRLKALTLTQGQLPIPKGPLPKNVKMPNLPR